MTDNRGGTHTSTQDVDTTMPPNQHPNAVFTSTVTKLKVTFNSNGSSDPDGTIASRLWDFGDGQTSTDTNPVHTYGTAGTFNVSLTVTDNGGETDVVTHDVTTVANVKPTASFTNTANNLAVTFNAGTSADTDGTIASYAWKFGDGTTGTGATPSHTYGAANSYDVKLTVTDNDGATDVITKTVVVTAPTQIAADDFNRTVANGWGTADLGGAWTTSGTASNFAVAGGNATITDGDRRRVRAPPERCRRQRDVEVQSSVSYDKAGTGGGMYTSFIARRNGTSDYRAVVRVTATAVTVQIQRTVGGTATVLGSTATLSGGTLAADNSVQVKFQVDRRNSTTLQAKVWRTGDTEPTAWT